MISRRDLLLALLLAPLAANVWAAGIRFERQPRGAFAIATPQGAAHLGGRSRPQRRHPRGADLAADVARVTGATPPTVGPRAVTLAGPSSSAAWTAAR